MKLRLFALGLMMMMTSAALAQSSEESLKALIQSYADTYARKDAKGLSELYADDGLLLPPNRPMIKGRDAIADFWKNSGGKLTLTPVLIRVEGNVGYVIGTFAFNDEPPSGKFTVTAARNERGKWLITADMWNDDQKAKQ
ncbi:MAG TPA: DUF4440 domain-containing protein [Terriglobales bacterium]|nr:DUF4440 domain-containing protein [Terriglobales bacterium]